MKNYKSLIVYLFLISATTFGQRGPMREHFKEKKDQIKALKIAFITTELKLTSDEATKFWPLFNEYEDKQQEIKKLKLKAYLEKTDNNSLDNLSEKEAADLIAQMEKAEEDLFQLKKKFISNLRNVIPSYKILKLKKAEEQFSKKLLQLYRDKKNDK